MNRSVIIVLLLLLSCYSAIYPQGFKTEILSDDIYTLKVHPYGEPLEEPIITLNNNELIEINFDLLIKTPEILTYRISHFNSDGKPSQLLESEYMSGFQNRYIEDYATSFNTTRDYVNYRLIIPNEDVNIKVSGNYAVSIYPENSDKPLLTACFYVSENSAKIEGSVSPLTDKGMNSRYQAVNFEVTCGNEVVTPIQDLRVFVRQNDRIDNEAALVKPLGIHNRTLNFEHNQALIFDAGNEYRVFEMTSHQYNGLNIDNISFRAPYYHAFLKESRIRSNRSYFYEQDINGRFLIRSLTSEEPDTEADYYLVHFFLPSPKPLRDDVYILSKAFNNAFNWRSRMEYSHIDGGYVKTVPIKEGYYNYLYVSAEDTSSPANCADFEGNYYQTENEYRIWVYYRPLGARYDRLLGVQSIQYK